MRRGLGETVDEAERAEPGAVGGAAGQEQVELGGLDAAGRAAAGEPAGAIEGIRREEDGAQLLPQRLVDLALDVVVAGEKGKSALLSSFFCAFASAFASLR